jgi:hypothetical protein
MYSQLNHIKIIIIVLIFLGGLYFYIQYGNKPQFLEGLTTANGEIRCPNILIQKGAKYFLYNSNIDQVPGVNPIMFNNLDEYTKFIGWQHSVGIRCPVLYVQNTYDAQGKRVYKIRPSVCEPQGGLPPSTATNKSNKKESDKKKKEESDKKKKEESDKKKNSDKKKKESDKKKKETKNPRFSNHTNDSILGAGFIPLVDASRSDYPYNKNSYPGFDQTSYYIGHITPLDKISNNDALLYNSGGTSDISDNPMDPNWGGHKYTQKLVDQGYYRK